MIGCKILEAVRELEFMSDISDAQNTDTDVIKVCNVAAQATGGLAPPVLRLVSKVHVARPEFCVTEGGELGGIRPEHQRDDDTLKIAPWFRRRLLKVLVGL